MKVMTREERAKTRKLMALMKGIIVGCMLTLSIVMLVGRLFSGCAPSYVREYPIQGSTIAGEIAIIQGDTNATKQGKIYYRPSIHDKMRAKWGGN